MKTIALEEMREYANKETRMYIIELPNSVSRKKFDLEWDILVDDNEEASIQTLVRETVKRLGGKVIKEKLTCWHNY